jgi:methyl-accepting chemotaxis protein
MNFPIDKLAVIVGELFDLSEDTRLSDKQRSAAYRTANQLHSYSEILAQKQFDSTTAQYQATIKQMNQINNDLADAAEDIQKLVDAVNDAASLVGAVEDLLKTAASFGTAAGD